MPPSGKREIHQYDNAGKYVRTFDSIKSAAKESGASSPAIRNNLNKINRRAGEFRYMTSRTASILPWGVESDKFLKVKLFQMDGEQLCDIGSFLYREAAKLTGVTIPTIHNKVTSTHPLEMVGKKGYFIKKDV